MNCNFVEFELELGPSAQFELRRTPVWAWKWIHMSIVIPRFSRTYSNKDQLKLKCKEVMHEPGQALFTWAHICKSTKTLQIAKMQPTRGNIAVPCSQRSGWESVPPSDPACRAVNCTRFSLKREQIALRWVLVADGTHPARNALKTMKNILRWKMNTANIYGDVYLYSCRGTQTITVKLREHTNLLK